MKTAYIYPVVCGLSLAAVLCCSAEEKRAENKPTTIAIKSLSYDPKKVELQIGDSVVWTNQSRTKHSAASEDGGKTFDTGMIEPNGSSKPIKFDQAGEFKYYCKVHGKTMSGTIIVKATK